MKNTTTSPEKFLLHQQFDSEYFGFEIYQLTKLTEISEKILHQILKYAYNKHIRIITCLIPAANKNINNTLEHSGFTMQEIKVTYKMNVASGTQSTVKLKPININNDLPQLQLIAGNSFEFSRVFNHYFPKEKARKWYVTWLINAIHDPDKTIFVVRTNNLPSGFIICKKKGQTGIIDLIAVDPKHHNQGLGTNLVYQGINWFKSLRINEIITSTQGENLKAQIFYQKLGFMIFDIKKWYYKLV